MKAIIVFVILIRRFYSVICIVAKFWKPKTENLFGASQVDTADWTK